MERRWVEGVSWRLVHVGELEIPPGYKPIAGLLPLQLQQPQHAGHVSDRAVCTHQVFIWKGEAQDAMGPVEAGVLRPIRILPVSSRRPVTWTLVRVSHK